MVFLRNYQKDKDILKNFIEEYYEDDGNEKKFIYKDQVLKISKREQTALYINLEHIYEYNEEVEQAMEGNGLRYQKLMYEAIDEILYDIGEVVIKDDYDIFIDHRMRTEQNQRENANERLTIAELRTKFPSELLRRYEVYFTARKSAKIMSIRNVLSNQVGHIIRLKAIVIRTSQVKPLYRIATYTCDRCGCETYQELINKTFTPLTTCMSESCRNEPSKQAGKLHLLNRACKKTQLQELRIQELSDQVPVGNIPRLMTVYCTGQNTRLVQPGEHVLLTGVFLPLVRHTYESSSLGLALEMFLDCHTIHRISKNNTMTVDAVNQSDIDVIDDGIGHPPTEAEIERLRDRDMYSLLANSIAPEIFGHGDIKRAILVLLAGGRTIVNGNGSGRIRGTINLCLMGDPGVAKSQLLGFVDRLSPRSQFTTGRGSSGVGLTAAVCKDPLTGEMTLEAGSLVLADGGVCCIDEFDKMAESDRTAIHEVMEQQTISIAKAGINTTLNARVSILAAANPAFGRYNPRRTIEQNIDLPAALLSRFDLLWLIQDKPDREKDLRLAQHITFVHTNSAAPPPSEASGDATPLSMKELRRYLSIIQRHPDPVLTPDLASYITGVYVSIRSSAKPGSAEAKETTYTSARTLQALLRICTALARIRLSPTVDKTDVDEAIRLLEASKMSVRADRTNNQPMSYKEAIYQIVRRLAAETKSVKMADVSKKCVAFGFTPDQITEVVDSYEELNVWQCNIGRTRLQMVN